MKKLFKRLLLTLVAILVLGFFSILLNGLYRDYHNNVLLLEGMSIYLQEQAQMSIDFVLFTK